MVRCDAEGYNGKINMRIDKRSTAEGSVSYLAEQYYKLPLQIMTPFYPDSDGTVSVYLLNPSGGVMEYDNFRIDIYQEDDTKAQILTPSANKVYRRKSDGTAHQSMRFTVGSGAWLEYLPDEMIPFKDSAYSQETDFYLQPDSRLITWDIMAAGRVANEEQFAFFNYTSQVRIFLKDELVLCDRMKVLPEERDMHSLLCMDSYFFLATVYAYAGAENTEELVVRVREAIQEDAEGAVGISSPEDGFLVIKVMNRHMYKLHQELRVIWSVLRSGILHKEITVTRKY